MPDSNTPSLDPEQIKKILLAREHARADAWLRKDRKALEALLAPDFVEINSLGRFNRNEILDRLFPSLTLHAFTIEDPVIHLTGETGAVLRYRCRQAFTMDGKRNDGTFHVIATYRRYNNQYRLSIWEIHPTG
jgi:hypothetical protein